ncbi:MAG: hypothetical protein MJK07_03585, partial [Flavobacteriales bacterium]|nr:hypothetical protein [Flavobacteriales bacterium]
RVTDANNGSIIDQSDATFTINAADPVYVLYTPNGGEQFYPTTSPTVKWLSAFTGPNVALDYSTDNGSTWNSVVASYPDYLGGLVSTEGTYSWTVPNTPTTDALFRVSDAANPTALDSSDAVFTIKPHIVVTTPNGAQSWERCSTHSITWTHGGTSGTFEIEYSEDGGTTWNIITSSVTGTSYSWLLPNITSSQMKIRVSDAADALKTDDSDAVFDITPPAAPVSIIEPNGGQTWIAGTIQNITYSSPLANVKLLYSLDNGVTWIPIVNNTSGPAGSYAWTIPNTPTTQALIRIENNSNSCDYDQSDATFTIGSSVDVTAPNGGQTYQATVGEQSFPNATIQASNATLVLNTVNYTGNATSYTQTFVPDNPLNKLRIQFSQIPGSYVRVYNGPSTSYPLLGTFYSTGTAISTHYTGAITVLNSGAFDAFITSVGTPTQNITWDITGTSQYFDIDYSTDGGTSWKRIVNDYRQTTSTGNYNWQVPNATTTQALIRVTDANNGSIIDQSDATFTINAADPVVLVDTPNGGEIFYQGESHPIEWRTTNFNVNNVQIEFSRDFGITWELIATNQPNSGTYNWTIPVNITEAYPNCKVRVSMSSDLNVYDENDALFEIRPGIILESPNTNLSDWNGCTQSSITWYAGSSSNYSIELSTDNGTSWNTIESSYTNGAFFVNYPWDVPNANSTDCQVRVTDNSNPMFTDVSEVNFTIIPSIEITSPNTGGTYIAGTVLPVVWADTNSSFFYNIDYSIDNGVTWTNIVTNYNTTGGLYNWTLPMVAEPNVLLRVTDFVDNCKLDITNVGFSISLSPIITVVTPNGGESLSGCTPYNITWTDSGSSGNVNIKYSIDGGSTWDVVVNNTPSAPLTYSWNTPNQLSSNCVIRIEDVLNLNTNYDHSNNVFSIDTSFTAIIASGGITEVCAGGNVTLTSNSPTGNYWYPNGETTSSIVISNPGIYTLEVNSGGCISTSGDYELIVNPVPSVPVVTLNGPTTFCANASITLSSSSATGNYWLPNGETTSSITTSSSGAYSVVVTENGCSATSDTITITVIPLPSAPIVTSNSIVPFGGTLILSTDFSAGMTYNWVGPNGFASTLQNPSVTNVTAADNGIYILNTQVNGCSSPYTYHTVGIGTAAQTINVAGNVATEIGSPIKLATADATDGTTTFTTLSDNAGNFNLNVGQYSTYDLIPSKDNDNVITNGISTLDLILIQSHILGVTPLSSPYKILAADVNGSSSVTTFDMVLIRQLILGATTTYPNGQKWVFVDEAYNFPNPQIPFTYPSDITISSGTDLVDQNFIGIKLGDVSLDWDAVIAFNEPDNITFYSEPDTVDMNEEFMFPVLVDEFSDVLGVQFTMEWPTQYFEYMEITGNTYGINFSEHLVGNGHLTGSWFDPNVDPMTLSTGDTLFMMKFKVINSFGTEKISVNSEVTKAEGYDPQYGALSLSDGFDNIVFRSPLGVEENTLTVGFEVYPNPSSGIINIDFVASQDDVTTLELIDTHGKLIKVYDIEQKTGLNTVTIDFSNEIVGISNGQIIYLVLEQNGVQYIRKITLH